MPKASTPTRYIALVRNGASRVVVHASAYGADYADAEAAALAAIRLVVSDQNLSLDNLEELTTSLEVIPEGRADKRYPRAMREWRTVEEAVSATLAALEPPATDEEEEV